MKEAHGPGPTRPRSGRERLIVALDYHDAATALAMVDCLGEEVTWYKIGMELFYAEGRGFLDALFRRGKRVFLDLKLHDIPNTMAMAVRSLAQLRAELCTLHLSAGPEALRACAAEVRRIAESGEPPMGLLGVTRLTSLPPLDPSEPWKDVLSLAGEGVAAGLYGWIAPPGAAGPLRAVHGSDPVLVCPGIRLPHQERQDQAAVGTPEEAVRGGADWIVMGRPITRADDPRGAAREITRRLA
jgi:orotidine-5'-phosphate decarboxylase